MSANSQGIHLLRALKASAGLGEFELVLRVGNPAIAWLRPVATLTKHQSSNDVHLLTQWRNANVKSFLSEFEASEARTSAWLADSVAGDDSRILFMIDTKDGETIGYMGIAFIDWEAGYAEADSIVKAVPSEKGLASKALSSMISWARGQLQLSSIGVRVRSDNPAVGFYLKMGFEETHRTPLSMHQQNGMLVWQENPGEPSPSAHLIHMRLSK